MILSVVCVSFMYILGLTLAIHNLKRDKSGEIAARREYRKNRNNNLKIVHLNKKE